MGCIETKYPREIKNQIPKIKEKEAQAKTNLSLPQKEIKAKTTPDSEVNSLISEKDTKEELLKIEKNAIIAKHKIPMIKTAINSQKDISLLKRVEEISDGEKAENIKEEKSLLKSEILIKKESETIIPNTKLKTDNNAIGENHCENLNSSEKIIFPNLSPNFDFSFIDDENENEKIIFDVVKEKETMVDQLMQEFIEI